VIFGKYINRYYLRHAPALLLGILALLMVDYIQLLVPQLYRLVINGVNLGQVVVRGETMPFTKEVLFQHICLPNDMDRAVHGGGALFGGASASSAPASGCRRICGRRCSTTAAVCPSSTIR